MGLTTKQISSARTGEALFKLLSGELTRLFPPALLRDTDAFLAELRVAPRGLRAMAATYELDVSMALDDLAWHFVNHHDTRLYEETRFGLRELEANEAADLFEQAFAIIAPRWEELGQLIQSTRGGAFHDWLDSTGIQKQIDLLNDKLWRIIKRNRKHGLMRYWVSYARKYPDRCVGGETPTAGGDNPKSDKLKMK